VGFFNTVFLFCFWDRVLLCSPTKPLTHVPPASTSQVLGLQACITSPDKQLCFDCDPSHKAKCAIMAALKNIWSLDFQIMLELYLPQRIIMRTQWSTEIIFHLTNQSHWVVSLLSVLSSSPHELLETPSETQVSLLLMASGEKSLFFSSHKILNLDSCVPMQTSCLDSSPSSVSLFKAPLALCGD
jgi:hypothetical protein